MNAQRMQLAGLVLAMGLSGAAQATLVDRGGGLIYDTDLDVTWLADAYYARTSGYDEDGQMTWSEAVTWAANLSYFDSVRNVTYTDWRLPTTTDTGTPGAQCTLSGTDCGFNADPASSEMAHLFFTELGNLSAYTASGAESGSYAGGADPYSTLDNTGSFAYFPGGMYWSGTEYGHPNYAWFFSTIDGSQDIFAKSNSFLSALAVRPGDVAAVPEAETYALMLAGLGLIGWRARRRG